MAGDEPLSAVEPERAEVNAAKEKVIVAAQKVETARTAPMETFDMRDFWYAINGLTIALTALALARAR